MGLPVGINQLLNGKVVEWERIDFKKGWNPEDVVHSICAFANDIHNWGGGYIVIGVEEDKGTPILPPFGIDIKDFLRKVDSNITEKDIQNMPFEQLCWQMQIIGGTPEFVRPKNVGLLFFSENPEKYIPYARIELVRFYDDVGDHFDEKILHGPIHLQLQEALDYIRSQIIAEKVVKVDDKAEANRAYNYPYTAIEEVLSNAVYHKSYDDRNPIEVRIEPTSIIVYSLAGPMPPVTNADFQNERVLSRNYRNRRIGDFLKELDMTEGRSTGFPKIYSAMKNNGSPAPIFKTDGLNQYFLAELPIHPAFVGDNVEVPQKTTQKTTQNLTGNQRAILDYLQENPDATRKDIAEAIYDISEDGVKYNLARLQDLGVIKRKGGRKHGYWEVILI